MRALGQRTIPDSNGVPAGGTARSVAAIRRSAAAYSDHLRRGDVAHGDESEHIALRVDDELPVARSLVGHVPKGVARDVSAARRWFGARGFWLNPRMEHLH